MYALCEVAPAPYQFPGFQCLNVPGLPAGLAVSFPSSLKCAKYSFEIVVVYRSIIGYLMEIGQASI